ncbi:hypothetical protein AnigIFM62618_000778 [Aspergillus niger]|nr:hypothetical protein AnigIFM62618_000778 [Aspergillus niger]
MRINQAISEPHTADPNRDPLSYNSAANVLEEKLRARGEFATWLVYAFGNLNYHICNFDVLDALKELQNEGALLITTNYDDILEKHCGLDCISRSDDHKLQDFLHRSRDGILHIHGSYRRPEDVVLDATRYYKVSQRDAMKHTLENVLDTCTVLFIGCGEGLHDPNSNALLEWVAERTYVGHKHYFLVQEDYKQHYSPLVRLTYRAPHKGQSLVLNRILERIIFPTGQWLQTSDGHGFDVDSMAFSKDGKILAATSSKGVVQILNPSSGRRLQTLESHTDSVTTVAFSQDGKMLASAASDRTVQLWNSTSGHRLQTLKCHDDTVTAMNFSHGGTILASVSYGKGVQVWNPTTGHLQTIEKSSTYAHLWGVISFSKNGKMLASISHDELAQLSDQSIEGGLQELVRSIKSLRHPWDIVFFADLNGFWKRLDGPINWFLTVTGSFQDAFANTATCYIRWRWGDMGIEILNWLSHLLLAARLEWPRTSQLLRIHGESTSAIPLCVELQGQLSDKNDASDVAIQVRLVEGKMEDYKCLVANIGSQLAWIEATFQDSPKEGLAFSRARITNSFPTKEQPQYDKDSFLIFRIGHAYVPDPSLRDGEARCWHELFTGFNVAFGFKIPYRGKGMRGVELPFSLLTTFGCVSYPVRFKGGFVIKGHKTALLPHRVSGSGLPGKISAVQWHLFVTRKPRLYMEEVSRDKPYLRVVKIEASPTQFCDEFKQAERHFLGLYQASTICAGTNDSKAELLETARGQLSIREKQLRSPIFWSRNINISAGFGAFGASFGASTGMRIPEERERLLRLSWNPPLRKYLSDTRANFALLYNVQSGVAWLLPRIFVVMHLVQSYIRANYRGARIVYPVFNDMSLDCLASTFEQFQNQTAAITTGIDLQNTFKEFSDALDQLQDESGLKPANNWRKSRLAGVDFAQLASMPSTYSILETDLDRKYCGNWPDMLRSNWEDLKGDQLPFRVITLFCANLEPQPIRPVGPGQICNTWYPPPSQGYMITTIYCLRELARRYGEHPVKLSLQRTWECGKYGPYDMCTGRACDRLQKIVKSKRRPRRDMSALLSGNTDHAAVVFGGDFCIHCQAQCLQVTAAPSQQQH